MKRFTIAFEACEEGGFRAYIKGIPEIQAIMNSDSGRKQSRVQRWATACANAETAINSLIELQSEYQDWRDGLPDNLDDSAVAGKLDTIIDLDLEEVLSTIDEARNIDLPLGYGKD